MAKKKYFIDDVYTKRAQKEGFRARSYYKFSEIDKKYNIVANGKNYLDLGAAPGAWTQYIVNKTKGQCCVDAVDLQKIKPFENVNNSLTIVSPSSHKNVAREEQKSKANSRNYGVICLQCDVFDLEVDSIRKPFHAVISDMAPATTGSRDADSYESYLLALAAAKLAIKCLLPDGFLLVKYFEGAEMQELRSYLINYFYSLKSIKPKASRSNSREIFILGRFKSNLIS